MEDDLSNLINEKLEDEEDRILFKDSLKDNDGANFLLVDHQGILHAV